MKVVEAHSNLDLTSDGRRHSCRVVDAVFLMEDGTYVEADIYYGRNDSVSYQGQAGSVESLEVDVVHRYDEDGIDMYLYEEEKEALETAVREFLIDKFN